MIESANKKKTERVRGFGTGREKRKNIEGHHPDLPGNRGTGGLQDDFQIF